MLQKGISLRWSPMLKWIELAWFDSVQHVLCAEGTHTDPIYLRLPVFFGRARHRPYLSNEICDGNILHYMLFGQHILKGIDRL